MTEHFLERMTWPEVEAARTAGVDAVLIPIGSTEQHGRHLPLAPTPDRARALPARRGGRRGGGSPSPRRADAERDALLVPHAVPRRPQALDDDVPPRLPRGL